MSRSALDFHAEVSNDWATSVAIFTAYLYFYGIAAVKSRDFSFSTEVQIFIVTHFVLNVCFV